VKNYWLLKSEPEEFSIDDLERVGREPWSGVRNYQARNFMRDGMRVGDGVLFYHSNCKPPGVVGVAEVVGAAYPDPTQFDPRSDYFDPASERGAPRWLAVDVGYKRTLRRCITLDELKADAEALGNLALLRRGNRLSVLPVSAAQWKHILKMEKTT
jgi:predicted RNA-binding protein with PUA-like domain